jgi:hypothetical protein
MDYYADWCDALVLKITNTVITHPLSGRSIFKGREKSRLPQRALLNAIYGYFVRRPLRNDNLCE